MKSHLLWAALVGGASLACGAAGPSTQDFTASQAAIRAAEEVGAKEVPDASLHLKLAQELYDRARKLEEERPERAILLLEKAKADAELALVMAREHAETEKARELEAKVDQARARLGGRS